MDEKERFSPFPLYPDKVSGLGIEIRKYTKNTQKQMLQFSTQRRICKSLILHSLCTPYAKWLQTGMILTAVAPITGRLWCPPAPPQGLWTSGRSNVINRRYCCRARASGLIYLWNRMHWRKGKRKPYNGPTFQGPLPGNGALQTI